MKNEKYLLKFSIATLLLSVVFLTSCSPRDGGYDVDMHRAKIQAAGDSYSISPVPQKATIVENEVELFDRPVSVTFFNESLKTVLPALVNDIKYSKGIDKNILVSLEIINNPVSEALHKVLKPIGLSYVRTTGGILVVKQKHITFRAFNQPLDIVLNAMLGDISYIVKDGAEKSLKKNVSVEFKNLPIEMALDRLLAQLNIQWKKEAASYVIFRDKEAMFTVNFPLIEQSFSVSSSRVQELSQKEKKKQGTTIADSSSRAISKGSSSSLTNLTSTIEKFLTDTGKVIIHKEIGMIWVKDHADVVDRIGKFLASVNDSLSRSVAISGVITEVELNESQKFGIDWTSVAKSLTRAGATIGSAGGATGANFTLGWKGSANSTNIAYIDALRVFGDVKVVSRPSLRVANNAIGSLVVGKNTSYVGGIEATASSSSDTAYAAQLKTLQTGLNFYVLPHIISDTKAILYISPELTSLQEMRLISSGGNTPDVEAPTISMRQTQTVVPIRNGESIVIGGLMAETKVSKIGKTIGLSNIPFIGELFKTADNKSGVSEFSLMVNVSW